MYQINSVSTQVSGMSVDQMLVKAGLDWEVETSPVTYGTFNQFVDSNHSVAYRSDTGDYLDTYGGNRKPLQNRDMVTVFDNFLKKAGLEISNLGSLNQGKEFFAACKLPSDYDFDIREVGDITQSHLIIRDSHISGNGLQVFVYFDRLVCKNGMTSKINQQVGVIAHNGRISNSAIELMLNAAMKTVRRKRDVLETLSEIPMNIDEARLMLINTFGDPDKENESQKSKLVQTALRLFEGEGMGSEMLHAYHTAYGLLNSVTETFSHHTTTASSSSRFASVLSGNYAKQTEKLERQLLLMR